MATKLLPAGLCCALAALLLAGCGVKGDPQLPAEKADTFPSTYPPGAVPSETRPENIFVDKRR